MPKQNPPPQPARPLTPAVWQRFVTGIFNAADHLARGRPSPQPGWTDAQFAVAAAVTALDLLMAELSAPADVRALIGRLNGAFLDLRLGTTDPLFEPKIPAPGGKGSSVAIWFRAHLLVRLEADTPDDRGVQGNAADVIVGALRRAGTPEGYRPSANDLRHWRSDANRPAGRMDEELAAYRDFLRTHPLPDMPLDTWAGWLVETLGCLLRRGA